MKSPLHYQATEYDCGPTTMTNAIMFLFEREEIPPDLVRHIGQCTLDSFDEKGHIGRYGTSGAAIRYFGSWFNELRHAGLLPIRSRFLEKDAVFFGEGSVLNSALCSGAAVVVHVYLHGYGHYLLLTGMSGSTYLAFDPYYADPASVQLPEGVTAVPDQPFSHNLILSETVFMSSSKDDFSLGEVRTREALILSRENMDSFYMI